MKEIQQILKKLDSMAPDENAVLATVVDVKGSSYRLPGAKMLILENGQSFGTVSGGCLEADVLERAQEVMDSGEPQIFVYDTTNDEDSVFSFNMGCRGVIRILLEPVYDNPFIDFLKSCFESKRGVAATLIKPSNGRKLGERYFFDEDSLETSELENEVILKNARAVLESGISRLKEFDSGEIFLEYIAPPVDIKIFGAGADAVPLAGLAKSLGWHVTVVDHRQALANNERFENPDSIIISRPEGVGDHLNMSTDSIAVVMTHNYEHDKQILKFLFEKKPKYIGALGPRVRTENILQELKEEGVVISEHSLEKLHAPVGLDIGANLPETIALSIIAEIQAFLAKREGGFLKNRTGSIYGRDLPNRRKHDR